MMSVGDAICVQVIMVAVMVFASWASGIGPFATITNLIAGTALLWLVWAITQA